MGRRRTIVRLHQSPWINQRKNLGLGLNRRQIARRNPDPSHPVGIRKRVGPDRLLRSQDGLVLSRDLGDHVLNPEDRNRVHKTVQSQGDLSRLDRDRVRDLKNHDPRAMTGASRGNRDPIQVTQDLLNPVRNLWIKGRITLNLIGSAMVVQAAAQNPRRRKARRIKTILRYEKRKMAYKLKDPIGKLIKTIAVVIAIPAERENQPLREEALHHARIGVGPRTEIGIETEIDRGTDREIDHAIDHAIDHEIGTEGNISKFLFSNFSEHYYLKMCLSS